MKYQITNPLFFTTSLYLSKSSLEKRIQKQFKRNKRLEKVNEYFETIYKAYSETWNKYGLDYSNTYVKKYQYNKKTNSFKFVITSITEGETFTRTKTSLIYSFEYPKDSKILNKREYKSVKADILAILLNKGINLAKTDYIFLVEEMYQMEVNRVINDFYNILQIELKKILKRKIPSETEEKKLIKSLVSQEEEKVIKRINEIAELKNEELNKLRR